MRGWNAARLLGPELGLLADRDGNIALLIESRLLPSRLPSLSGRAIRGVSRGRRWWSRPSARCRKRPPGSAYPSASSTRAAARAAPSSGGGGGMGSSSTRRTAPPIRPARTSALERWTLAR